MFLHYAGETVVSPDGDSFICTTTHEGPGTPWLLSDGCGCWIPASRYLMQRQSQYNSIFGPQTNRYFMDRPIYNGVNTLEGDTVDREDACMGEDGYWHTSNLQELPVDLDGDS